MSDLAFDRNGDPIVLPATAQLWRVRRFRSPGSRGAPEVVLTKDGAPLFLPIDIGYLEFRDAVGEVAGRYRLDPLDEGRKLLNAPAAYVTLADALGDRPRNGNGSTSGAAEHEDVVAALLRTTTEMARMQADVTRNLTDKFAGMMTAAAELVRAADGAGIVARQPLAPVANDSEDDDEELDDEDAAPAQPTLMDLFGHLMPALSTWLEIKKAKAQAGARDADDDDSKDDLERERAVDGGPGAALEPPVRRQARPRATRPPGVPSSRPSGPAAPSTPTAMQMAHLVAVQAKLSPGEREAAQARAARMADGERAALLAELSALSVDDAAARVQALLAEASQEAAS